MNILRVFLVTIFTGILGSSCGKKVSCECISVIKDRDGNSLGDESEFDANSDTGFCEDLNTVETGASGNLVTTSCAEK